MKADNIINNINVYARTSNQAKKCPNELKKLYKNVDKLCKEFDKIPSSITILAGYFNSKVGKGTGAESCIGQWSRDKRNQNGTNLVWWNSMERMIKSLQTAASNTLKSLSQPDRKAELTW